jgi:hypothetical protein
VRIDEYPFFQAMYEQPSYNSGFLTLYLVQLVQQFFASCWQVIEV